jgi:hypothetical protein
MIPPKYSFGVIIVAVTMGSDVLAMTPGSGHWDGAVTSNSSPFLVTTIHKLQVQVSLKYCLL